jgi:hypothetical protein
MAKWRAPWRGGYAAGPAKENPKPPLASVTRPAFPRTDEEWLGILGAEPGTPTPEGWGNDVDGFIIHSIYVLGRRVKALEDRRSTMEVHVPYLDN